MSENKQNQGLVIATHGRHVWVESTTKKQILCYLRGKKNSAVVGDNVTWSGSHEGGVIEKILPRKSLFFRQDQWRKKSFAANLDLIIFVAATLPDFSEHQLSRVLLCAAHQHISTLILLNKEDLEVLLPKTKSKLQKYEQMGYPVLSCSLTKNGIPKKLLTTLKGKTTLVLGPSGVGKSTLVNLLVPDANTQTQEISQALSSGKHTTTSTHLYWVNHHEHTAIIDSPGFQEFGLHHISPQQLPHLMPDIASQLGDCKFYNCTHLHEPGCSLRSVLDKQTQDGEKISLIRYQIYTKLFNELSE